MRYLSLFLVLGCAEDAVPVDAWGEPSALPDAALAPPGFTLGGDTWMQPGGSFDLVATGGPAGVLLGYAATTTLAGAPWCPAALAPTCLTIAQPARLIGVTSTDGVGTASYSRFSLPGVRSGQVVAIQAAGMVFGGGVVSNRYDVRGLPRGVCLTNFSGPYAMLGDGGDPEPLFAPLGVHFLTQAGHGLVGGDAQGDVGDWSDGAAVMTPGWGLYDYGTDTNSITFDAPVTGVAVTLERAQGGTTIDVEITGTLGGAPAFVSASTITSRGTFTFFSPVDRLDFALVGGDGDAYVIDDLAWTPLAGGCP